METIYNYQMHWVWIYLQRMCAILSDTLVTFQMKLTTMLVLQFSRTDPRCLHTGQQENNGQ